MDVERRPHWDSELIEAVTAILFDCYDNGISEAQTYQAIAVVEDWQDKQIIGCRYACVGSQGAEIAELRAQIQRAREVLDRWVYIPPLSLLDEVNRALNGDNDE